MRLFSQHLLVFLIVLACAAVVGWQIVQTFAGRKSKLGSCCSKGCEPSAPKSQSNQPRPQFLPLESLTRRRG
jgi:hypothetical protein